MDSKSLFDEHGRLIPTKGARVFSQVSRRYFTLLQPELNFFAIHTRIQKHLGGKQISISVEEFEKRARQVIQKLDSDPRLKGLLNGIRVPFFRPASTESDLGTKLTEDLVAV